MRWVTSALLTALCALPSSAAAPPMPISPVVLKLIDQLGEDDAEVRKSAEKKLESMGDEAVVMVLRRASKSHADVDVRLRAAVLAAAIEKNLYGLHLTMKGAGGGDCNVAVSSDGRWILSGGDTSARLWNVKKGKEERCLNGSARHAIIGVALSPDGKWAATGAADSTVRLWEVHSGKGLHILKGHTAVAYSVVFRPDGKQVLSASADGTVRVWDAENGKEMKKLLAGTEGIRALAVSRDSKHLLAGGLNGNLFLINLETGKDIRKLAKHEKGVMAVALSPDGKLAAASGFGADIRLHDLKTGKVIRTLDPLEWGKSLMFSSDSRLLLSGGHGAVVRLWDVSSGGLLFRGEGHTEAIWGVSFLPGDRMVVSSSEDRTVRLWHVPR
jgi:WD40 repeat protein